MNSKRIFGAGKRNVRVHVLVGACIAASILPGHIFAESFEEHSNRSDAVLPVSVDVAAVAPSYELMPRAEAPKAATINQAQFDQAPAAPAKIAAAGPAGFSLSQVESIRVRVWGIPDLGGEYAINADSSLSFPRIGRIEIGSMSAAQLEQMLAAKLSELARADVAVAVEVARFRPYFIMGQVVQAGAMEWKPGLKIIQAISLARGVTRSGSDGALGAGMGSVDGPQSRSELTFSLAQLERLKAERDGTDTTAATARIESLVNSTAGADRRALQALVSRQNDMLSEQRSIMETQLSGLRRSRQAAERELEAAQSQEQSVRAQLEIMRDQLTNLEGLKTKRLISNARFFEQKNSLLGAEIRSAEVHAMVERARARLSEVEQQLTLLPKQRRAALSERIDVLERRVSQLRLATGVREPGGEHGQSDVLKLKYNIARESDSGVQMIAATVFTEIMPGDVVIVSEGQDASIASIEEPAPMGSSRQASAAETAQRMIEDAAVEPSRALFRRTSAFPGVDSPSNDE